MSIITGFRAFILRPFSSFTTTNDPVTSEAALEGEPPTSRYRMDNDSSDVLTLPDGRKLGYAQYGSLTGRPVLYQHGLPGCRLEAAGYNDLGLELGVRIIAPDRPGYGWSSPHPSRKLLDWPKDLEHLANHLKLDEYSVLGVSGGGPYALACAKALPSEKLKCVSLVCGLGPPDIGMRGAGLIHWVGFTFGWRYSPAFLMRWFFQREPSGRLDWSDEKRLRILKQQVAAAKGTAHPKDIEVMSDEDFLRLHLHTTRECFTQGWEGMLLDGKLSCMDFGFRIEDIRPDLPVKLWYGKYDFHVPLNHGIQIAARLGGRASLRVEDDTHASISQHWKREQLEELLKSMKA